MEQVQAAIENAYHSVNDDEHNAKTIDRTAAARHPLVVQEETKEQRTDNLRKPVPQSIERLSTCVEEEHVVAVLLISVEMVRPSICTNRQARLRVEPIAGKEERKQPDDINVTLQSAPQASKFCPCRRIALALHTSAILADDF